MIIALDVGGTKIRIAEVTGDSLSEKNETFTPKSKKEIISVIVKLIKQKIEKKHKAICIGVAGIVKDGKIIKTPNLNLSGTNLKKILERKFSIPVFIENDARCAGLAEKRFGAAKKYKNFVLLTLGTGIGGAVFIGGKLHRGNGYAGEIGHMLINGRELENAASGKAFEKSIKNRFKNISFKNSENAEFHKNKDIKKIYEQIGRTLGMALLNISYVLDPEIIILGGGFSDVKFYWQAMVEEFRKKDLFERRTLVVPAKFGNNSGLIGAGLLSG